MTLGGGQVTGAGGSALGLPRGGRYLPPPRREHPRLPVLVLLPPPCSWLFRHPPVCRWAPGHQDRPWWRWGGGQAGGWGVSPALGCDSRGARAFGHSRAEEQVVQPWGQTDGREMWVAAVLLWPPPAPRPRHSHGRVSRWWATQRTARSDAAVATSIPTTAAPVTAG